MYQTVPFARAAGPPPVSGVTRQVPEDFTVEEVLGFKPTGAGEHVLLQIRKRDLNSHDLAGRLARLAGVAPGAVGYCGLKDRRALTTQWFSVALPGCPEPDWTRLNDQDVELLRRIRHRRKLRRGSHRGNCFEIRVRDLVGDQVALISALEGIAAGGVPNYFGPQRFGPRGVNLCYVEELFGTDRKRVPRHHRSLLLSTARSWLFNLVLSERVAARTWNHLLPGDVANLAGSRSIFAVAEVSPVLQQRLAALDIHPTGPLYGAGDSPARELPGLLEQEVFARYPQLTEGLRRRGLKMERRPLRCVPRNLRYRVERDGLLLQFELGRGEYATSVLQECLRTREFDS